MQKIILLLCSFVIFSKTAIADTTNTNVTNIMKGVMDKYGIPGAAVLIYKDGQIDQYLFGVMNKKTRTPVKMTTVFELGSITKTFSGLLLAQNVSSGKIHLDDKLVNYMDNSDQFSDSFKHVTLLQLATYTSSLPFNLQNISYNAASNTRNSKLFKAFLHTWIAPYPSGSAELYSNVGFAMLGMAMAYYEEAPLAQVMQQNILQPLGMDSSFLTVPANKMKVYSQGYTAKGKPSRSPQGGLFAGSWAMKSSVTDMKQYLYLAVSAESMPSQLAAAMKIAQTGYFENAEHKQIGLAWFISPLDKVSKADLLKVINPGPRNKNENQVTRISTPTYNANALIEKTGSTNGFRAYIGVIPAQKIGIVILTNKFIFDSHVIEHTGRKLLLDN
ncbi:MAG: ampC [Burkholderiales bacterium]|jgi:beta-lactamase class C|nr:ampC [Burkholderiales bacterium]